MKHTRVQSNSTFIQKLQEKFDQSAIIIQSYWRGFYARQKILKQKQENDEKYTRSKLNLLIQGVEDNLLERQSHFQKIEIQEQEQLALKQWQSKSQIRSKINLQSISKSDIKEGNSDLSLKLQQAQRQSLKSQMRSQRSFSYRRMQNEDKKFEHEKEQLQQTVKRLTKILQKQFDKQKFCQTFDAKKLLKEISSWDKPINKVKHEFLTTNSEIYQYTQNKNLEDFENGDSYILGDLIVSKQKSTFIQKKPNQIQQIKEQSSHRHTQIQQQNIFIKKEQQIPDFLNKSVDSSKFAMLKMIEIQQQSRLQKLIVADRISSKIETKLKKRKGFLLASRIKMLQPLSLLFQEFDEDLDDNKEKDQSLENLMLEELKDEEIQNSNSEKIEEEEERSYFSENESDFQDLLQEQ
eukprot:403336908